MHCKLPFSKVEHIDGRNEYSKSFFNNTFISKGEDDIIAMLIENGVNVEQANTDGENSLHRAAETGTQIN